MRSRVRLVAPEPTRSAGHGLLQTFAVTKCLHMFLGVLLVMPFALGRSSTLQAADEGPSATGRLSFETMLSDLSDHSRGRRLAARSRRLFLRHAQISILVATWAVLLATPVIIWPLGESLWNFSCHAHSDPATCIEAKDCVWRPRNPWFWRIGGCEAEKSGYLSLWGTMLLQFIFSVYVDLGTTVRLTVQGSMGTMLAFTNMLVLNLLLGFALHGGAAEDPPGTSSLSLSLSLSLSPFLSLSLSLSLAFSPSPDRQSDTVINTDSPSPRHVQNLLAHAPARTRSSCRGGRPTRGMFICLPISNSSISSIRY